MVIEDTQSQAEVGKDKAKKLIEEDHVFAVVVLDRLENQQAIGEYLNSRKVPNIEIQTPANLSQEQVWTFGVTIDHAVQGKLVADYFVKVLRPRRSAIVSENTPTLDPGRNDVHERDQPLHADVQLREHGRRPAERLLERGARAVELGRQGGLALHGADAGGGARKPGRFDGLPSHVVRQLDLVGVRPHVRGSGRSRLRARAPSARGFRSPTRAPTPTRRPIRIRTPASSPTTSASSAGAWARSWPKGPQTPSRRLGQNSFRDAMQHLQFRPDIWAPIDFRPGVREGANVVAVLRQDGDHWALEHDFTGSF